MWKVSPSGCPSPPSVSIRPKNGGDVRVGGQRPQPGGARGAQPLGRPGVDAGVGDRLRGGAHAGQALGGAEQVGTLGGEHGVGGVVSEAAA